jgi:hypothetical protein
MTLSDLTRLPWRVVPFWLLLSSIALAQGSAGTSGKLEPRVLVDVPTAGMLDKGSFAIDLSFYQEGGILFGLSAGIFNRLSFGISYGGSRLIGSQDPILDELPGVNLKIRVLEETPLLPALAIGFDSQGKDGYLKELRRYVIKSPGLYAVLSKNYLFLGYLSLHGGVNYSFEQNDDDRDFNAFLGLEKTLGPVFSLVTEYNLAFNDNSGHAIGRGRGYLNAGFRWTVGSGLTLTVNLKDLTSNGGDVRVANRTISLECIQPF